MQFFFFIIVFRLQGYNRHALPTNTDETVLIITLSRLIFTYDMALGKLLIYSYLCLDLKCFGFIFYKNVLFIKMIRTAIGITTPKLF